jgi:hypothetical protein
VELFNASISARREEVVAHVSEEKRSMQGGLGSCIEGRPEDAATISGLTFDGRQSVRPVGLKGCLGRILLWRSN